MTDDQLIRAAHRAHELAHNANVAYWSKEHREYMTRQARDDFALLAGIMGYTVARTPEPAAYTEHDAADEQERAQAAGAL